MDPHLLPFVEDALRRAPVARWEVRHREKSGESVVAMVDPEGKAPPDLAALLWDKIEEDAAMHLTESAYWVCFFRFAPDGSPEPTYKGRKGFWTNRDKLSKDDNPIARALGTNERSLAQRESHIIELQEKFLMMHQGTILVQQKMIQEQARELETLRNREVNVIDQYAQLKQLEAKSAVDLAGEKRKDRLFERLEGFGLQLLGEATKGKDGSIPDPVRDEMLQSFVDTLNDQQVDVIMGSLRDDQKGALASVLRPFVMKSLEKKRLAAAESAGQSGVTVRQSSAPAEESNG